MLLIAPFWKPISFVCFTTKYFFLFTAKVFYLANTPCTPSPPADCQLFAWALSKIGKYFSIVQTNIFYLANVKEPCPTDCQLFAWVLEHKICALAINRSCHFLFLVLVSPQTTRVLRVYNVFRTWVVWSENRAKIIAINR